MQELWKNKCNRLGFFLFVIITILIATFTHLKGNSFIDSDHSSELILAKILSENNEILTKDWHYSTELRVLNTQVIYALGWKLFPDFKQVRIFGQVISLTLFYFSAVYFFRAAKNENCFLLASFLLLPFSILYFRIVLFGIYYIPHLAINFLLLGLFLRYTEKRKISFLIGGSIIAYLAGMGGFRQIVITTAPLIASCLLIFIIEKFKKSSNEIKGAKLTLCSFPFSIFIFSAIGLVVNLTVLQRTFSFKRWTYLKFSPFAFENLSKLFKNFFILTRFQSLSSEYLSILSAAISVVTIIIITVTIISSLIDPRSNRRILGLSWFAILTNLFTCVIIVFTTIGNNPNYILPGFVSALAITLLIINSKQQILSAKKIKLLFYLLTCLLVVSSAINGVFLAKSNDNKELQKVSDFLIQRDYKFGFADFWSANVLTEISNGYVEMVSIDDPTTQSFDSYHYLAINKWLVSKVTLEKQPDDKVFLVFNNNLMKEFIEYIPILQEEDRIVYQDRIFTIYSFKNYDEIAPILGR